MPLAAEIVVRDGFVFPRRVPAQGLGLLAVGVFGADGRAPREVVVDLEEIVVAEDGLGGLDPAEEVHHAFFQFGFEAGDGARGVDFGEGHAEFVGEAPEAGEEDGAGEEVVLGVRAFEHDGEVVLDEARAGGHGVFGEGAVRDVEGFVGGEVVDSGWGGAEEGGVALGEVGAAAGGGVWLEGGRRVGSGDGGSVQLFEEFDGAVHGFGGGAAAFGAALGDAAGFVGVEL